MQKQKKQMIVLVILLILLILAYIGVHFYSKKQEEKENAKDKHKKSSKSFQTYCFLPLKGHNYSFKLSAMFMLTASNIDKCNKGKNCNYNYVPLA